MLISQSSKQEWISMITLLIINTNNNLRLKQRKNFVSHTEQPSSVPVVCNKACVYSRYAETSIHSKRWLRGTLYSLSAIEFN